MSEYNFRWMTLFDGAGLTASTYTRTLYIPSGGMLYLSGAVYGITGGATVTAWLVDVRPNGADGCVVSMGSASATFYVRQILSLTGGSYRVYFTLSGGTSPTFNAYIDVGLYTLS